MKLTEKQVIEILSNIDKAYRTFTWEEIEALEYAIKTLKTDEVYQIMYEGGEIFTKADMVAMLTDIQLEIEELRLDRPLISRGYECYGFEDKTPTEIKQECSDIIQQKINKLKENKE